METISDTAFLELVVEFALAVFLLFIAIFLAFWWRARLRKGTKSSLEEDIKSIEKLASEGKLTPEEQKRIRQAVAEKMIEKMKDPKGGGQL